MVNACAHFFIPVVTPILHDMLLYDMRSIFGFDRNDYGVNKKRERKVPTFHICRRPQNIKTHFSCMGFHNDSIGHCPLCMDVYISKRLFNI